MGCRSHICSFGSRREHTHKRCVYYGRVSVSYHALPKAELHLHLEGSLEPETLIELDPSLTPEAVDARYRFPDFAGFIESYKWVTAYLTGPGQYALVTRRLLERLAGENVRYAEVNLSAGVVLFRGRDLAAIWGAVREEARRSAVETRWIFDAVRHFGPEEAVRVAKFAAERTGEGVVAFGIGGDEALGPAEWFGGVFRFAREHGLRLTAHAGETTGPESVWAALRLGAERIGHGIRSIEDPALLTYLREKDIPLEICIASNVATGAISRLEDHPVRRIYEAGVPIVLGSDDPAMFRTSLTREFELAAREFGFSEEELRGIAENGFRYAFAGGGR